MPADALRRLPNRHEADLDALIQRPADPAQHRQGVAFVIGVLEAADDRCRGADEPGKLGLREVRRGPEIVNLAGDFLVRSRLLKVLQPGRLASIKPAVNDLDSVGGGFRSFSHAKPPGKCASPEPPQTASCDPLRDRSPLAGPPAPSQGHARPLLRPRRGRNTGSGNEPLEGWSSARRFHRAGSPPPGAAAHVPSRGAAPTGGSTCLVPLPAI